MVSLCRLASAVGLSVVFFFVFASSGCLELEEGDADADGDSDGDGDIASHGDCELVESMVERPELPPRPAAVDYLIVAADDLVDAAEEHARYRDETGHRAEVLTLSEILDGEAEREAALELIRQAIAERRDALGEDRPLFVLLLGDATRSWGGQTMFIPAAEVSGFLWAESPEVTSDNSVADLDGDDLPDVALGRVPVASNELAAEVLGRTRDLERAYLPGSWNYQVHVFASEAGFGEIIDSMIEDAAFAAVREVPYDWQLSFTYARPGSPYTYPPAAFSDQIYQMFNSGSVLMTYIGHGYEEGFDSVNWEGEVAPILDTADIDQLDVVNRSPLLMLIACLTGSFDTGQSLAEDFLHQPGGPVALVASTEISHPYANGVLIREMAFTTLTERRRTVGEAFLEAKRRMVTAAGDSIRLEIDGFAGIDPSSATPELREDLIYSHEHMYVLFGDPAHPIQYPAGEVELRLEQQELVAGEEIRACIQVHGPPSGDVVVTLETDRETLGSNLESWEMDDPDRDDVVIANYELANDKAFERFESRYGGGGLFVSFPTSTEHTGELVLRAYARDGEVDAIGSNTVVVRRGEQ